MFPEGARGISKPFAKRYQLADFGLGFMRLALETDTPIVPVAVIGGEEQYISLGNFESLAKALGMPTFPIIPQLLLPGGAAAAADASTGSTSASRCASTGDPDDDDAVIEEKVCAREGHDPVDAEPRAEGAEEHLLLMA